MESEFSGFSLSHYQSLCEDLDITPIPKTVGECKALLRGVFVNIVDLMQYRTDRHRRRAARKPEKFRTLRQLRKYCQETGKYYSKKEAKAETLRVLLKVLT